MCGPLIFIQLHQARGADGSGTSAVTLQMLAVFLREIEARLADGEITPDEAAEELEKSAVFAPLGQWWKRHRQKIGGAAAAILLGLLTDMVSDAISGTDAQLEQIRLVNEQLISKLDRYTDTTEELLRRSMELRDDRLGPETHDKPQPATP